MAASHASTTPCLHMIRRAEDLGLRPHPVTKNYWVKSCRGCKTVLPDQTAVCCICQGRDFADIDPTTKFVVEPCAYQCRECDTMTEQCDLVHCPNCRSTRLRRCRPKLICAA